MDQRIGLEDMESEITLLYRDWNAMSTALPGFITSQGSDKFSYRWSELYTAYRDSLYTMGDWNKEFQ
jgi:hypothetical protein